MQPSENELRRTGDIVPEVPVEIKRFSQEQRELLERENYLIYGLKKRSVKALKDEGRDFRLTWHKELPLDKTLNSIHSEVAINLSKPFLVKVDYYRTSVQQEEMVEKFSQELGQRVPGVKAIIGQIPDYLDLAFVLLDATGQFDPAKTYLFGAKNYFYRVMSSLTPLDYISGMATGSLILKLFGADNDYMLERTITPLVVPI